MRRYILTMIRSFRGKYAEAVWVGGHIPKGFPPNIRSIARRKLVMVDAAVGLNDLARIPGNKLHPMYREHAGKHAIWINGKWRVMFRWTATGPEDVEITDYH